MLRTTGLDECEIYPIYGYVSLNGVSEISINGMQEPD